MYRVDKYLCSLAFFRRFHPLACIVIISILAVRIKCFIIMLARFGVMTNRWSMTGKVKGQLTRLSHVFCGNSHTGEEAICLFSFFPNGGASSRLILATPLYLQHTYKQQPYTHDTYNIMPPCSPLQEMIYQLLVPSINLLVLQYFTYPSTCK